MASDEDYHEHELDSSNGPLVENKENITVIYFDFKSSKMSNRRFRLLKNINDGVLQYTDIEECINRMQAMKKEKIIFVTRGKILINIYCRIVNIRQIDGIFIFARKLNKYKQFNEKLIGIFSRSSDMIKAIRNHIKVVNDQILTFNFYRSYQRYTRKLSEESSDFIWFHVFKKVVNDLPHDGQAKKEMLDASKHYYRNNIREMKRIYDFEQNYRSEQAIMWYTKNSFIYRLINKALRTEDVEQLYSFRYFIQDLHFALTKKHDVWKTFSEPIIVYRGLRLTQQEFDDLTQDKQQLVSMNGYLSTSFVKAVAEMYAGEPTLTSDKLSVLLEIECDVEKLGNAVIFADITSESNFRDENEVLFDFGTTLKLTEQPKQKNNGVWYLKMAATDEGRAVVQKYIDDHLELSALMSPRIMFGTLLYTMGKYDSSLRYFRTLIENPEDEDIVSIHLCMARALSIRGSKDDEWKHYETAYDLIREAKPKRAENEATILTEMGIFHFDRDDNDQALDLFMRGLHLYEEVYGGMNIEVAQALVRIAGCYEQKGEYSKAVEYYQRALKMHEECAHPNHVVQCQVLIALGNSYRLQCKYEEALAQFRCVLDIRTRTLPKQHSDIADCLSLIGKTLGDMDNQAEGVFYSLQALQMYCKTLPVTELNENSSVLVDIGIGFSSIGAHQLALQYYQQALDMKKKCLQNNHPDFAAIFENMSVDYSYLNKHILALRYALKACRYRRQIGSSNHPDMVNALKVLSLVYSRIGCFRKAKHYLEWAKKIFARTAFEYHPNWIELNRQTLRIKRKIQKDKHGFRKHRYKKLEGQERLGMIKHLSRLSNMILKICLSSQNR